MHYEKALKLAAKSNPRPDNAGLAGTWRNAQGSSLTLTVDGQRVSGTVSTQGQGIATEADSSAPVMGYITGDLVAFVALWKTSGSITSWTGQILSNEATPRLKMTWRLITEMPETDEPEYFWMSGFDGSDDFKKAAS